MFVIPMAGLSSRFFKAGYTVPKYQLTIDDKTVFARSLLSFSHYFDSELFVIILRDVYDTKAFVEQQLKQLGIKRYLIRVIENETQGQAHTVYLGINEPDIADDEPVYIFNIDTFRYHYRKPNFVNTCDGYLEVFEGEGEHWSFIEINEQDRVVRTTEKERISNLCSDGLYYFATKKLFCDLFEYAQTHDLSIKGELYIAPLYNLLIKQECDIRYVTIKANDIDFCGTPAEYEYLKIHGLKQAV